LIFELIRWRKKPISCRAEAARADIDVGLRSYMLRVYNYMSLGVAFTGAIAMTVAMNAQLMATVQSTFWLFFIGILGLGWFAPKLMVSKSIATAQVCFWVYAGLWGGLLGPMLYQYAQIDPMLIARAFFISAGAFAGMSLFGYTTKRNDPDDQEHVLRERWPRRDDPQGDLRRLPALWRLHHHVCLDPAHPGHDARRLTRHKQTARPKARGRPRAFFFRTPVPW
jgi:hypothetical protein